MTASRRVLITGASGLVGQVLRKALADDYEVAGVDARRRGRNGVSRADMTRLRHAERAVDGADVVIDLASAHWRQPWDVVRENNIPAVWNTLEAARRRGVRRVIYASSNHVTGLYERDEPYVRIVAGDYHGLDPATVPRITTAMAVRPDGPYGVGKALGEAAARYYAEEHGLSVLCLRIGTLNRANRPSAARHFATLITHADMARLARCCIEAPPHLAFGLFYGVSANRWRIWDVDDARRAIGYEPRDDAEEWRGEIDGPAGVSGSRRDRGRTLMAAVASLETAGTRLRSRTSVHAFRAVRDRRTSMGRDDALLGGFASPLIAYPGDPLPSATFRFDNMEAPGGDAQARSRGPRNGEGRGVTSGDAFRSSGRSCMRRLRPVTAKGGPVCPGTLGGSARNAVATWLALLLAKDGTRA